MVIAVETSTLFPALQTYHSLLHLVHHTHTFPLAKRVSQIPFPLAASVSQIPLPLAAGSLQYNSFLPVNSASFLLATSASQMLPAATVLLPT